MLGFSNALIYLCFQLLNDNTKYLHYNIYTYNIYIGILYI